MHGKRLERAHAVDPGVKKEGVTMKDIESINM